MNIKEFGKEYDVVVVGGGTAGAFSAIASAMTGAKTLLVEKNSMLGGTMTVCDVSFPGLFFAWGKQIIGGPCWDVIKKTAENGGAAIPEISVKPKNHWDEQIFFNKLVYLNFLNSACVENGVDILTNAMPSDISEQENGVRLVVTCKEGMYSINAKKCIDATGDANLVSMAGNGVKKSETQQPATLINRISGYDISKVDTEAIKKAFPSANFPDYVTAELLISYLNKHSIELHIPCKDADTSFGKTQVNIQAVHDLFAAYSFLRQIKGLENLTVEYVSAEAGIRETSRIIGEYEITAEDYITGKFFDDSVCYAFYPIDLHVLDGIKQQFHKENTVAKVPYRALIPKGSRNLLCAGRCISSDTLANSGLRVEAVCMATGQAAGCAAALAAKKNISVKDVDYSELIAAISAIGGIVPKE